MTETSLAYNVARCCASGFQATMYGFIGTFCLFFEVGRNCLVVTEASLTSEGNKLGRRYYWCDTDLIVSWGWFWDGGRIEGMGFVRCGHHEDGMDSQCF